MLMGRPPAFASLRSLAPGRLRLLGRPRHEVGMIAAVNEDHTPQLVAFQRRPAPARAFVHFGHALPGPLHGGLAIALHLQGVDVAADQAELEVAHAAWL